MKVSIKKMLQSKKNIGIIIGLFVFGVMLALNILTPMYADDYSYSKSWVSGRKMTDVRFPIVESLLSAIVSYFSLSGRLTSNFLTFWFCSMNRICFDVINAAAFVLLIYLISYHVFGKKGVSEYIWIMLSFFLLWKLTPGFAEDYLWLTGACNYLYCTIIILLLLIPFRIGFSNKQYITKKWFLILSFIGGVFAGITNETSATAVCVIILGYIVMNYMKEKKVYKWMIGAFIGDIAGAMLILFCPGEHQRADAEGAEILKISLWIKHGISITKGLISYFAILMGIICVLLILVIIKNRNITKLGLFLIYGAAAFCATYVMIIAPYFPDRTWLTPLVLAVIALGHLYREIKDIGWAKYLSGLLVIVLFAAFLRSYSVVYQECRRTSKEFAEREEMIEEYKSKGVYDAVVPVIVSNNHRNIYFSSTQSDWLKTLENPITWPNDEYAFYYGLNSFIIKN